MCDKNGVTFDEDLILKIQGLVKSLLGIGTLFFKKNL